MTRECVVQVLADASSSRSILESVSERVEHSRFVRDPQVPLVPSKPFDDAPPKPSFGRGARSGGGKREEGRGKREEGRGKREEGSLGAGRAYPVYKPKKSNQAGILGVPLFPINRPRLQRSARRVLFGASVSNKVRRLVQIVCLMWRSVRGRCRGLPRSVVARCGGSRPRGRWRVVVDDVPL